MFCRNNDETKMDLFGEFAPVKGCLGPRTSQLRGMDSPCCVRCNRIRTCYYRDNTTIIENDNINFEYINEIKNLKPNDGETVNDLSSSFVITNCGSKKTLAFQYSVTELSCASFEDVLFEQFCIMQKMGIIIKNISKNNFSLNRYGIPVVFPGSNYDIIEEYGDDSGISFIETDEGKFFTIKSTAEFLKSGKWLFLYNYYKSFLIITNKCREDFSFFKTINGDKYYKVQEFKINIEKKLKKNSIMPEEKIKGSPNDKYVVLDLDSTLISAGNYDLFSNENENPRFFYLKLVSRKNFYKIFIRKHFKKFINDLVENGFKLIVWSAGCEKYVKDIVSFVFKNIHLEYVFTYEHTSQDYKKLSFISNYIENFNIENCRLVDDNKIHEEQQEKYFVYIEPFSIYSLGEKNDDDVLENFSECVIESFKK